MPPEEPQSRAEKTGYAETSTYEDVRDFLADLGRRSALLHRESFAISHEGREIPLVVLSDPPVGSPQEARALGRPVAFVMANIHAGEVEGKEACQHLVRRALFGDLRPLLGRLVLLVAPIYNVDGNERLGPQAENRPGQNGPALVGVRGNATGLDLNRDYVKLESPEARGLVTGVFRRWDPHLIIDCHATDGSFHGYGLTWSPPLSPNAAPGPVRYVRERLMPVVTDRLAKRGLRVFPYGNFDDPKDPAKGWRTFDHRPRFGNSYVGLRKRLCVLSEAYVYDDFRTRVASTEAFVVAILERLAEDGAAAMDACAAADLARPETVGLAFDLAPPRSAEVLHRETPLGPDRPVIVPVEDAFAPTRVVHSPLAYFLEPSLEHVASLIARHGIEVERLEKGLRAQVEKSRLLEVVRAGEPFQGHRTLAIRTERVKAGIEVPAGSWFVPLAQPLADLACYLLEPESDDGAVTWNFLDAAIQRMTPGAPDAWLPIHRLRAPLSRRKR